MQVWGEGIHARLIRYVRRLRTGAREDDAENETPERRSGDLEEEERSRGHCHRRTDGIPRVAAVRQSTRQWRGGNPYDVPDDPPAFCGRRQ